MQYYLCPRCKFHVPAKKSVCTTCGFDMVPLKNAQAKADDQPKANFLNKLFGGEKPKEQTQEKPVLS